MMKIRSHTIDHGAGEAVDQGLSANPKRLPSWLFYDDEGDKLFQAIMRMPEYYVTSCEYEILHNHRDTLLSYFTFFDDAFRLIELGAGDGLKTQLLLEYFAAERIPFEYVPVDVSAHALELISTRMKRIIPDLKLDPREARYEDAIAALKLDERSKVVLFLGANIGNYPRQQALTFMKHLFNHLHADDLVLMGFDLKKDPRIIQRAYDDPNGITEAFNLNLLKRINRELGGDFRIQYFEHYPTYDPVNGEARSYLVSKRKQAVRIDALGKTFLFQAWEPIHTEVSQKYDLPMIEDITARSGFQLVETFFDSKRYFCDVLLRKP